MIEQTRGYKYRIYPNKKQKEQLNKAFGCCRFVFNHFLDLRSKSYKETGKGLSYNQTSRLLTELKATEGFEWLKETDSTALQNALRDLDTAFKNFFSHNAKYPKFKSKHNHRHSYRTQNGNQSIRIEDSAVVLPKLGRVKLVLSRSFEGKINHATVEKTCTGKYFVTLCVTENVEVKPSKGGVIGIDVGLKEFYTDSNGNKVANPKFLYRYEKKLARAQRRLSKRKKGSKNRNKQRIRVARIHEKIKNIRNDFLHKQSTALVKENQIICVEDLKVKEMKGKKYLAKMVSDVSWSSFFRMLEYKVPLYGSTIRKIPSDFPSSQICSCCGYRNEKLKNLSVRKWVCPQCGNKHDRDLNASKNILAKGLLA